MADSVQSLCQSVVALTDSDDSLSFILTWVNERYRELINRAYSTQLRHWGSVFVPAPLTSGTVAVTNGSTTVTGTNTAFSASQVGWFFRVAQVWYAVVAVNATTQTLTLNTAYSEQSNSAATYQLVQRYIPIPQSGNARHIENLVHPRLRRKLRYKTNAQMELQHPGRLLVGAYPWCWTEAPRFVEEINITPNGNNQKMVEVYPPSSQAETYSYSYWSIPSALALTDTLPPEVDAYVLREGVLVDVYRFNAEKAARANQIERAAYYQNVASRQRTIWEAKIQEALVANAAARNLGTVEFDMWEYATELEGDIVTAYQDVILGWTQ
jgi:hypothetical protein